MSNEIHGSPETSGDLKRSLSNRHLQLIAIGGAIGTGLFMGSGKTISLAGPSILIIYMIIGFMVFLVMRALGELLLSNLAYKSFIDFATDLIGPWAGYFVGWTYWLCWITIGIADLSAIIYYLQFFNGGNPFSPEEGVMISIAAIVFIMGLNLVTVKLFGELEFWFALIKIIAIVVLIGVGLWMIFTGFTSTAGDVASFNHLWSHGGIFPTGVTGFLAGFQIAIFAFVGVELVGTTAAETKDPEHNLPKAVNSIPIRIIIFYVLSLVIVMSVTPWNKIDPSISPFVNLFSQPGSKALIVDLPSPGVNQEPDILYVVGLQNFLSIVNYNRSYFYAQSVAEFAQALGYQNKSVFTRDQIEKPGPMPASKNRSTTTKTAKKDSKVKKSSKPPKPSN